MKIYESKHNPTLKLIWLDKSEVGNEVHQDYIRMIYIPEGEFWMGSPENKGNDYEKPQHYVKVPAFYMSQTAITQKQWKAIAQRDDLKVKEDLKIDPSRFKGNDRPVERVTWYDAIEYCARLSKLTGRNYRLPSEAEWEYACRSQKAKGKRQKEMTLKEWNKNYHQPFHFGKPLTSDLANYRGTSTFADEQRRQYREETTPVGTFPPNAFGLYDMHGNVWEWCLDPWHGNYEDAPSDGSVWDEDNNDNRYQNMIDNINELLNDSRRRVLRGGSWYYDPWYCRSAYRYRFNPVFDYFNSQGFRIVCAP